MFSLKRIVVVGVFLLGFILSFHPSALAQICNPFAGGSCGNSTCDPRTQTSSGDACFGNGNCCYMKSTYPSTCTYKGDACQCTGETGTIPAICVDGKPQNFDCGGGAICVATTYVTCETALAAVGGFCPKLGHNCPTGWTYTYANNAADNDCDTWGNSPICCGQIQNCNTTVKNSSCQANFIPANDCGYYAGTIQKTYTQFLISSCSDGSTPDFTCTPSSVCKQASAGTSSCTTGWIDNCYYGNGYACNTNNGTCVTHIYTHIYIDYAHNGSNDANYPFGVVCINGGNCQTTGSDGSVTYSGLTTGTYTISYSDNSPDYQNTGATSQTVNLTNSTGNVTVNFRVTPLYKISGNIFNDKNKDTHDNGADTLYTGTTTVHVSGGPTSVTDMTQTDGTYSTPESLWSGNYTVSQTHTLNSGYSYTTPSTYAVTVGNPVGGKYICDASNSPDGTCVNPNNGSVSNLNFGVINENPWQQSVCYDVRDDSGTYTDLIPAAPSCGGVSGAYNSIINGDCSTGAGIIFTCDATPDFGLGSANAASWQAGGAGTQQECFTGAGINVIRTSYDYLLTTARESGITPINMATVCSIGSCTLPANLAKGVYIAHGDVHLNTYTFPVDANAPQGFIFLIDGNLYINGNILIPAGSVAAFSTSGNIYVDKSVGNVVSNPDDPAVNNPNLEGLYSADGSFIIQSYGTTGGTDFCNIDGTPKDKKLNVIGSIITNAAQKGGSFVNNRDLCIYDLDCSSVSSGDGNPDGNGTNDEGLGVSYILTLYADGKFLNHKLFNWEEVKP